MRQRSLPGLVGPGAELAEHTRSDSREFIWWKEGFEQLLIRCLGSLAAPHYVKRRIQILPLDFDGRVLAFVVLFCKCARDAGYP